MILHHSLVCVACWSILAIIAKDERPGDNSYKNNYRGEGIRVANA